MTSTQAPASTQTEPLAIAPAPFIRARSRVTKPNTMAILSFTCGFFLPVPGIVFGHVALKQIDQTREPGRGFAIAGLWISYASFTVTLAYIGLIVTALNAAIAAGS